MRIEKRSMGWIQKPSAYQYSQQLRAKRRAMAQSYLDTQASLSIAIFTAQDSMSKGLVEIAFKGVIARVQEQAKAQLESVTSLTNSLTADANASTGSSGSDVLDKTV